MDSCVCVCYLKSAKVLISCHAVGGIIATVQDPTSFNDFRDSSNNFQQFLPFFGTTGEGLFCVDVALNTTDISGIKDGANVTLQFVFDGGDGQLYQASALLRVVGEPEVIQRRTPSMSLKKRSGSRNVKTSFCVRAWAGAWRLYVGVRMDWDSAQGLHRARFSWRDD